MDLGSLKKRIKYLVPDSLIGKCLNIRQVDGVQVLGLGRYLDQASFVDEVRVEANNLKHLQITQINIQVLEAGARIKELPNINLRLPDQLYPPNFLLQQRDHLCDLVGAQTVLAGAHQQLIDAGK